MNKRIKLLTGLLITSLVFTTGAKLNNPKTLYRVYLKGKSLGLIKSEKSLENYIDDQQEAIKKKYGVDKVYVPSDLDIVKEVTFDDRILSNKTIYNKIKDISPFSIKGYTISIKGADSKDVEGRTIKGKSQKLYVLDKEIFTQAVDNTVKSFVPKDDYQKYESKKQGKLEDTGKVVDNIYIKNKITIKKENIPVDKTIYQDKETLSKYLMFGTTEKQQEYTVQSGDTVSDVAFNNKISTEEFLIANPSFTDENSLLFEGQKVTIGVLKPQFQVVEEIEVQFKEEKNYQTETTYDNDKNAGYIETTQTGVKGENEVIQKKQLINGAIVNAVTLSSKVLKEPITEKIVKGGKKSSYAGGGYAAGYGAAVATRGQWGWPATCSSISSGFGYRWGGFHDGVDINGCGYGSNIFAAQSGTVVASQKKTGRYPGGYGDNGEYIVIDHHNGYYSIYAHMCPGCRRVKAGDYVEKGQVIGGMGQTGAASGVHLHFGMWSGNTPYGRGSHAMSPLSFY